MARWPPGLAYLVLGIEPGGSCMLSKRACHWAPTTSSQHRFNQFLSGPQTPKSPHIFLVPSPTLWDKCLGTPPVLLEHSLTQSISDCV